MSIQQQDVCLLILAGGKARRMQDQAQTRRQNKALMPLAGKPMLQHILQRLAADMHGIEVILNANQEQTEFAKFGYPVIPDIYPDHRGPLSGIYSAMKSTAREWVLCLPCDIPLIHQHYISTMLNHDAEPLAWVAADNRQHPACCLLHRCLCDDLEQSLESNDLAVKHFLRKHHAAEIKFADSAHGFQNINTPDELRAIEAYV